MKYIFFGGGSISPMASLTAPVVSRSRVEKSFLLICLLSRLLSVKIEKGPEKVRKMFGGYVL